MYLSRGIKKILRTFRLRPFIVGRCADCLWFKTPRCVRSHHRDLIYPDDKPCPHGLLVTFIGSDVIISKGKQKVIKPVHFLSFQKTKDELMDSFELSRDEIEDVVVRIKEKNLIRKSKKREREPKTEIKEVVNPEIEEKAQELLKNPQILDLFLENSGKWIVMDETTRKIELFTCISAFGSYPLNLALQQVFSSGKTTTIVRVAKYFEDRDVWFVGAISPKALIHERGEYDEENDCFVIDLRKHTIIFLDEPEYHTLMMLKPLLSHDKFETTYRYVSDTLKTVVSVLKGWPACIFCAVKSKYTEEFTSRWLTASPQISREKIEKVIELKGRMAAEPEKYEEGVQFKAFKRAFQILKQQAPFKVVVPLTPILSRHFRAKRPADMRLYDLFLALIKSSCILHAMQKEKDKKGRLIATLQDYEIARSIFVEIEKPTVYGLGQNVLDFYENIILAPSDHEDVFLTYEILMSRYAEVYGRPISRSHMREEYLKPLETKGLIDITPDPTDKRRKLIEPKIGALKEKSLIDHEGFLCEMKMTGVNQK